MTDCPHCHQQIEISEIHYGTLFSCPLCKAVYFIGWDGQAELPPTAEEMAAEDEDGPTVASEQTSVDEPEPELEATISTEITYASMESTSHDAIIDNSDYSTETVNNFPIPEEEAAPMDMEPLSTEPFAESSETEPMHIAPATDENPSAAEAMEEAQEDYDFNQPLDLQKPVEVEEGSSTADQPGFQDVTEFANADAEIVALSYTVRIEGIDTGKIYGALKEALTDSRFGWDVMTLMKSVQNGSLELKGLNPAKAFVLVNRVKYLALEISWRQDVLTTP